MPKQRKPSDAILALPRRNRRALYLLAHREDHSVSWEPYRRWDGGREPYVMRGFDAVKAKEARKKARKDEALIMAAASREAQPTTGFLRMVGAIGGFAHRKALAARKAFPRRKTA